MTIAEHDLGDHIAHVLDHVFCGRFPLSLLIKNRADRAQYHFRLCPAQHVAAALNGLRPFRHITNRHISHTKDRALFLNSSAIAQRAEGVALKLYEVEETEGSMKLNL